MLFYKEEITKKENSIYIYKFQMKKLQLNIKVVNNRLGFILNLGKGYDMMSQGGHIYHSHKSHNYITQRKI